MAKIKKGKAKGPEQAAKNPQPVEAQIDTPPTAVPAVVPAVVALHPSGHVAHEETSHGASPFHIAPCRVRSVFTSLLSMLPSRSHHGPHSS